MTSTTSTPELWQAAYRIFEQNVVSSQLHTWIDPLEFAGVEPAEGGEEGLKVMLSAPSEFFANWARDNFKSMIESTFAQITGKPCTLTFIIREGVAEPSAPYEPPVEVIAPPLSSIAPMSVAEAPAGAVLSAGLRSHREIILDSRYVFENYVVGASNQFAHASAVAVAEHPARQYNPLFIYSPPGLGKTHLLHAIGNRLKERNPKANVAYLSAEQFVNELIDSLQHRRMSQFREKYRDSYDMILIDDIQFIAGKNTSEEEFFHTFNALHSSKRQIVVASDRHPKEIEGLEERIRTRFEWGLVADISVPEIETRIAILKAKAERDDIYLPDEVATFLATYIKTNVRELEGVLIRLQAHASLTGAEISLEMAKQELRIAIPQEGAHFTIEAIQNAVAKHFKIKLLDLKSNSRTRQVSLPRQIAMYLIRKYTEGLGYKEIGGYFGGKDHTTVMYSCEKIEREIETDVAIRDAVEAIQNLL